MHNDSMCAIEAGAVLARDVIVEVIIRRLFRGGIGAMEAVRASLRGVDDRRCERRFGSMIATKLGRTRGEPVAEIATLMVV